MAPPPGLETESRRTVVIWRLSAILALVGFVVSLVRPESKETVYLTVFPLAALGMLVSLWSKRRPPTASVVRDRRRGE